MNYLNINGVDYPIKYGRAALDKVLKMAGAKDLSDAAKIDKLPLNKWGDFIHAGLETGAKIEEVDVLGLEDVNEALDLDLTLYTSAQAAFAKDLTPKEVDTSGN